ncbi:CGNR zinc finger domain-containing protein [Streptomyces sp. NPDC055186]
MGERTEGANARDAGSSPVSGLPLTGEPLPLELVNTTYIRGGVRGRLIDVLEKPADLDLWVRLHLDLLDEAPRALLAGAGPADSAQLDRFLRVRAALRELLRARTSGLAPGPGDLRTVNEAARLSAHWYELGPGPDFASRAIWPETAPLSALLGEIAGAGVRLLAGREGARLRACPAPGCVLYFVQTHPRRTWCTPGCGNRVRVARHTRRGGA